MKKQNGGNSMGQTLNLQQVLAEIKQARPEPFTIEIESARNVLAHSMMACMPQGKKVTWLPAYDEIANWLSNSEGKGLLLMGPVGTGKTLIATHILPVLLTQGYRKIVHTFNALQLNDQKVEMEAKSAFFKVIDDVGIEPFVSTYGGGKRWVFSEVVSLSAEKGQFLVVATNLTKDEIISQYGERIYDRLRSICRVVILQSEKSLR